MIYIFPYCKQYESEISKIDGLSRLFAFPTQPIHFNPHKVILDSGAFGLSLQNKKMSMKHMENLSKHYQKYATTNTFCIAPDEFLNPTQSMWNLRKWKNKELYPNVTAVIQASQRKKIELDNFKKQADYYRDYTDTIFFSNNALVGKEAKALQPLFLYMKSIEVKWIHCLGAGWSIEDIKYWNDIKGLDSIDSIAYYSTADKKEFGSLDAIENIGTILRITKGG